MNRRIRFAVAGVGTVLVTAYAILMVLITDHFNPLAAAPGLTREEIAAVAAERGEVIYSWFPYAVSALLVLTAIGLLVATAAVPVYNGWAVAVSYLGMLTLGAFAHGIAGFPSGMAIADGLETHGADHSGLSTILHVASSVAYVLLIAVSVAYLIVRARTAENAVAAGRRV